MSHRIRIAALGCLLTLISLGCAQQEPAAQSSAEKPAPPESTPLESAAAAPAEGSAEPAEMSAQSDAVQDPEVKVARAESPVPASAPEPMPTPAAAPAPLPADVPLPLDGADAPQAMPEVVLSQALAAECKVKVGDAFPELKLADPAGKEQTLASLLSPKLTLVVFWNGKNPLALEELADMAGRYASGLRPHNVAIVGVNSGDTPQLAGELAQQYAVKFPVLCDADGAALGQVTAAGVPCCYLLDAQGKVLWFDTEYSPTTRRDLLLAVRFALKHSN